MSSIQEAREGVPAPGEDTTPKGDDLEQQPVSLGKRLRSPQTIVSFLIAFALIWFIFRNLNLQFSEVWRNIRTSDPTFIFLGFAVYYGSFPLRALRWKKLMDNAGISKEAGFNMPGLRGLSEMYVLSWFVNCLVPAKLGDAYRGYLLKKHAGPSLSRTMGTIFAERVMDIVALVGLLVLASLFVFHGTVPGSIRVPVIAGIALVGVGTAGLASLYLFGARLSRLVPARLRPVYDRTTDGLTTSLHGPGMPAAIGLTAIVWLLEGARMYFVAAAFGVDLTPASSTLVALLASLLTVVPITPAGLGVVEGGTIIALRLLSVTESAAASIAIMDRIVAYWSVILVGGVLYLVSKRK